MRYRIKILNRKDKAVLHECYCSIKELHGKEKLIAMGTKAENVIKFEIRYLEKLKVLKKHRDFIVLFEDIEYKMLNPDFNNYRKDKIIISVYEVE